MSTVSVCIALPILVGKKRLSPCCSLLLRWVYSGKMENRKLRFKMYYNAVKFIHGTGLGKGVRKQLPGCVTGLIQRLAPDKSHTGYIKTAST